MPILTYGALKKEFDILQQDIKMKDQQIQAMIKEKRKAIKIKLFKDILLKKENFLQIQINKQLDLFSQSIQKLCEKKTPIVKVPPSYWGHSTVTFKTQGRRQLLPAVLQTAAPQSPSVNAAVNPAVRQTAVPSSPLVRTSASHHNFITCLIRTTQRCQIKYGLAPTKPLPPTDDNPIHPVFQVLWDNVYSIFSHQIETPHRALPIPPPPFPRPRYPRSRPPAVFIHPPPRLPPLPVMLPLAIPRSRYYREARYDFRVGGQDKEYYCEEENGENYYEEEDEEDYNEEENGVDYYEEENEENCEEIEEDPDNFTGNEDEPDFEVVTVSDNSSEESEPGEDDPGGGTLTDDPVDEAPADDPGEVDCDDVEALDHNEGGELDGEPDQYSDEDPDPNSGNDCDGEGDYSENYLDDEDYEDDW